LRSRVRAAARVVGVVFPLLATFACAPALFVPPVGPGVPAPDARAAWTDATRACRGVSSYRTSLRVSGSIGGQHLPTTITVITGVTADGFRLEGSAAGRSIFLLAGTRDHASLYIDDGHRVATGRPEELTDALFGVKLGPERWLALLAGCVSPTPAGADGVRYGDDLAVTAGVVRVFLSKTADGWQVHHGAFDGLIVTYEAFAFSLPGRWRLSSEPDRHPAVSLSVAVDRPTTAVAIPPEAYSLKNLPADVTSMSLEELRQAGPLQRKGG
jgi:hypothetical protein